jgi:hypothetical protein
MGHAATKVGFVEHARIRNERRRRRNREREIRYLWLEETREQGSGGAGDRVWEES